MDVISIRSNIVLQLLPPSIIVDGKKVLRNSLKDMFVNPHLARAMEQFLNSYLSERTQPYSGL